MGLARWLSGKRACPVSTRTSVQIYQVCTKDRQMQLNVFGRAKKKGFPGKAYQIDYVA